MLLRKFLKPRITLCVFRKDIQTVIHPSLEGAEKTYLSLGSLTVKFESV